MSRPHHSMSEPPLGHEPSTAPPLARRMPTMPRVSEEENLSQDSSITSSLISLHQRVGGNFNSCAQPHSSRVGGNFNSCAQPPSSRLQARTVKVSKREQEQFESSELVSSSRRPQSSSSQQDRYSRSDMAQAFSNGQLFVLQEQQLQRQAALTMGTSGSSSPRFSNPYSSSYVPPPRRTSSTTP